jgi:hypothetical protein
MKEAANLALQCSNSLLHVGLCAGNIYSVVVSLDMRVVFEHFDRWGMHVDCDIEGFLDIFLKVEATSASQKRMGMVLDAFKYFTNTSLLLRISRSQLDLNCTIRSNRTCNLIRPLSRLGNEPFKRMMTSSVPSFNSSEQSKYPRRRLLFALVLKSVTF